MESKSSKHAHLDAFVQGVDRLPETAGRDAIFHQTRSPFTRLKEVMGRMRGDRQTPHPTLCQGPTCGAPLTDRYYRRADGLTLCASCFEGMEGTSTEQGVNIVDVYDSYEGRLQREAP
jgi:hypothetical protein